MKTYKFFGLLTILALLMAAVPIMSVGAAGPVTVNKGNVALSGGSQSGNFPETWDLTYGDLTLSFTYDGNGLVDDAGTHAWAELGIRDTSTTLNFNPTWMSEGKGIWLATDYDWSVNTFDPDPVGSPNLDMDDKLILQKGGGMGEGSYNLPSTPPVSGNNHRFWWDRDDVDPWQNNETANTNGLYEIVITFHATSATTGTAFMTINGLSQGFETDGNWSTIELTPAGMTFTGDMTQMQVFYGIYGYGATHNVNFQNIIVTGFPADLTGPITSNVVASPNPAAIGSSVTVEANVDDSATGGKNIISANYKIFDSEDTLVGSGSMLPVDGFDSPTEDVTASITAPTTAGIYKLCVYGTDAADNVGEPECIMFVVYDPSGGFVTGGGWIDSPAGAYYPSDLPYFDGSYYEIFFSDEQLNFFEARDVATGMTYDSCGSAHLATITSQGEYETVLGLLNEWPGAVLGGYQDEGVYPPDAGWQWVTGEPFEFETTLDWWLPGEPNDCGPANPDECVPGSEQVLEMYPDGWNDVPFYEPRNLFMVEYEDCDPDITGKATFGFVSKYKKGATVPEGNTEFQFQAGGLNFSSTSYQWLVVNQAGTNAQFKGYGTINGTGNYGFMLWAGDGSPDTFRIKIWDAETEAVVYDNDTDQPIGGGSIVVHKAK